MQIYEYIYKGVVKPSYKNIPRNILTVMDTAVIREEKPPRHRLTLRLVGSLASAEKDI